jgi:hypothetical protein
MKLVRCAVTLAAVGACLVANVPVAAANPYIPADTQDSAEFTIANGYIAKQIGCTPNTPASFDYVEWYPPGFTPGGGSGMIHDANPSLGGEFSAHWNGAYWDVDYLYC